MLSLGLTDHLRNDEQQMKLKNAAEHEKKILLQTLLLDMGSKFKVLIQSKGIKEPKLSGLQFSPWDVLDNQDSFLFQALDNILKI
jgi:SAM-dependent MidA family methyltransferase